MVGLVVACTPTPSVVPSAASQAAASPIPSVTAPDVSLELVVDGLSTPVGMLPIPGEDGLP